MLNTIKRVGIFLRDLFSVITINLFDFNLDINKETKKIGIYFFNLDWKILKNRALFAIFIFINPSNVMINIDICFIKLQFRKNN